jgi:hypothetical protein
LNHIISELLPQRKDGYRYANADPVTGQAAWYDLRVRIEKCQPGEAGDTEPQFAPMAARPLQGTLSGPLRYGKDFDRAPSGKTGGTHHEFIGNRTETAKTVPGVPAGHGNRRGDRPKGKH